MLTYTDPVEKVQGWFVRDDGGAGLLCAGGCRVQAGLTPDILGRLAARMTQKQRLLGLNVVGAKSGLDCDPAAPSTPAVISRFLAFLRLELLERYTMGTDMGTQWGQLEAAARSVGVPSVKYAIARAQHLSDEDYFTRIGVLGETVGHLSVQQSRAGAGLADAALAITAHLGRAPSEVSVAIHGFGTIGRGAAARFAAAGAKVTALADIAGCLTDRDGLSVTDLLTGDTTDLFGAVGRPPDTILTAPTDLLVLAACENAITLEQARSIQARAVVVGANNGLTQEVEQVLTERGVLVLPDFVGGAGGTASVDLIFGSPRAPRAEEVLDRTGAILADLTTTLLRRSTERGESLRQAADRVCAEHQPRSDQPPYGASPFGHYCQRPESAAISDAIVIDSAPAQSGDDCQHERATIVDSAFFGDNFSTASTRATFCDHCRFQRWLDVEAALARTQAELGIIPMEAAQVICDNAVLAKLDMSLLRRELARTHHSLVSVLRAFEHSCGDAGQWIHYGATTQDIQDTACALEMRDTLRGLRSSIRSVLALLAGHAETHRNTPMIGRTHAQAAVPITFGGKVANWIDELVRAHDRAAETERRVAVIELFGAAGTMASYGPRAFDVLTGMAGHLDLGVPDTAWHVSRDRPAEFAAVLALAAGAFGRIADEIRALSRPEIGEIAVPWEPGVVASSTMPHKRNADVCERIVVLARLAAAQVTAAYQGLSSDHERDGRSYWLEWAYLPDVSHYTLAAAKLTEQILHSLSLRPAVMWRRLAESADQVGSERLMFHLAPSMGKQNAHHWVYEQSQHAQQAGRSLTDHLAANPQPDILPDDLTHILDPMNHLGHTARIAESLATRAMRCVHETK